MLKLENKNDNLLILYDERVLFRFINNNAYMYAGWGKCTFKMDHGAFEIKEEEKDLRRLSIVKWTQTNDAITLYMEDSDSMFEISCTIRDIGEYVKVDFSQKSERPLNRFKIIIPADEDEKIYGCGERFERFQLRGQKIRIWVAEHQAAKHLMKKMSDIESFGVQVSKKMPSFEYDTYYAQPTFVSSDKYFVHIDSSAYMEFDFSQNDHHTMYIHDFPSTIYFGMANDFEVLCSKLSNLLGRQPLLPDWLYDGVIVAAQRGTAEVNEIVDKMLKSSVPLVGIWCQDWCGCRKTSFGYQVMWNWKWDDKLYFNHEKALKEWNKKGVRFLGYINPFLSVDGDLYKYASENDYCVKDKNGKDYMVEITTFPASMVDLTNPAACEWFKDIIKNNMIYSGISGWMADFGEYLPTDCVLFSEEDASIAHNKWPALWAKLNRKAIEECGKLDDIIFFTRSGYTGTTKYSMMMWNGDQHVDWSLDNGIGSTIPATLSLALSGFGLCHSDIGGYTTFGPFKRSKELLMRWVELSTFSPMMRAHEGNKPQLNVQLYDDEEIIRFLGRMVNIHKMLKPYLKYYVELNNKKGIPLVRPLFMHYDEKEAYSEEYEYMLGRDILVAPVIEENSNKRKVFLPDDIWLSLWDGKKYEVGDNYIDAPLGYPPVFYRADSDKRDLFENITKRFGII